MSANVQFGFFWFIFNSGEASNYHVAFVFLRVSLALFFFMTPPRSHPFQFPFRLRFAGQGW